MQTNKYFDWIIYQCINKWATDYKTVGKRGKPALAIMCIEDNKVFPSLSSCAFFYQISLTAISKCCNTKHNYCHKLGKHFRLIK